MFICILNNLSYVIVYLYFFQDKNILNLPLIKLG